MYYRYWEHDDLILTTTSYYGICTEPCKLVYDYADGLGIAMTGPQVGPIESELFDLQNDRQETHHVYDDPADFEIREDLKVRLAALQDRIGDTPYEPVQMAARNEVTGRPSFPEQLLNMLPSWVRENWL